MAAFIALLAPLAAHAGRNVGGAHIVPTDNAYDSTTTGDPPGGGPQPTPACGAAVTQSSRTPGDPAAVIWFPAAAHPDGIPGITAVQFGVDHNPPSPASIVGFGQCGSAQTIPGTAGSGMAVPEWRRQWNRGCVWRGDRGDAEFGPMGGVYLEDDTTCPVELIRGACCF